MAKEKKSKDTSTDEVKSKPKITITNLPTGPKPERTNKLNLDKIKPKGGWPNQMPSKKIGK